MVSLQEKQNTLLGKLWVIVTFGFITVSKNRLFHSRTEAKSLWSSNFNLKIQTGGEAFNARKYSCTYKINKDRIVKSDPKMNQKKNAPKEKKIPTAKMQEGIKLSLKKSIEHLDGAEALINKNLLNDSVALIQFAIEEFGRAVILRNMLRDGLETVERNLWYNHDHKYDTAFTVLPKDLQTIWESMVPITGIRATAYATAASSAVATAYV